MTVGEFSHSIGRKLPFDLLDIERSERPLLSKADI